MSAFWIVSGKATTEKAGALFGLASEMLTDIDLDNRNRVVEILTQALSSMQSSVVSSASAATSLLQARLNLAGALDERMGGLSVMATYREALAVQATDVDKRLGQQAGRMWSEIVQRRYDYGRPWRTATRVRKVTRAQLLAFYDRVIVPGAPEGRRLSTHVFARKAAPPNLTLGTLADEFYPPPPDRSDSLKIRGLKA